MPLQQLLVWIVRKSNIATKNKIIADLSENNSANATALGNKTENKISVENKSETASATGNISENKNKSENKTGSVPVVENKTEIVEKKSETQTQSASEDVVPTSTAGVVSVPSPPVVVVRQLEPVKPYNGSTSHRSFRQYYERICKANQWTTKSEKTQHLTLALEGPAVGILTEIEEDADDAYEQIWTALARRFGFIDEPDRAKQRFDARRQQDGETIAEFEQALRTLYREAWPGADSKTKDDSLKRKFEQGLSNPEMIQFLRLHARSDDFTQTVARARQFQDAHELTKPRKPSVRLAREPEHGVDPPQSNQIQPILDGLQRVLESVLSVDQGRQAEVNSLQSADARCAVAPERRGGMLTSGQRQQSPAPSGTSSTSNRSQRSDGRQRTVRFSDQPPVNRSQPPGEQRQRDGDERGRSRFNGQFRSGEERGFGDRGRQPGGQGPPRYQPPQGNNRQQWSNQPRQPPTGPRPTSTWNRQPAPQSFVSRQPAPPYQGRSYNANYPPLRPPPGSVNNRQSFARPPRESSEPPSRQFNRNGTVNPTTGRIVVGCHVCGRVGCHTDFHRDRRGPPHPNATTPMGCHTCGRIGCHSDFHQGDEQLSQWQQTSAPTQAENSATQTSQGNRQRGPRQGERAPLAS